MNAGVDVVVVGRFQGLVIVCAVVVGIDTFGDGANGLLAPKKD